MSTRALVVLGTGSQVPTRHRNHHGCLLRFDGEGFLFDPGEGTQRQLIRAEIASTDITKICITHFHGDHCLGLAGISQLLSLDGCPHAVDVHYPASGEVYYQRLRHASIYHDRATVRAHPFDAPGELWHQGTLSLRTLPLEHGVPAWGYRIDETSGWTMLPDRLQAAGIAGPQIRELATAGVLVHRGREVRLDDVAVPRRGQSFAFVMDTRLCDNAFALARGVDMLVCESTFLEVDSDRAAHHGHLTARQAGEIAHDAGVKLLVLTHFSRRYERNAPFVEEARAVFGGTIVAAADFDVIEMPKRVRPRAG
jgi:ribonuclease Z